MHFPRCPRPRQRHLRSILTGVLLLFSASTALSADDLAKRASSTAASWSAEGLSVLSAAGASVSTVGDLNGDGFSDFAFGAPGYDDPSDGFSELGAVHIRYGSAGTLPAGISQSLLGTPSSRFGTAVGPAGDVNGDGFDDLIVGAPAATFDGRVYLFLGSPGGLQTPAIWTYSYVDVGLASARLGSTVCGAGDVDGDGYDDVVIGAPDSNDYRGLALLFRGKALGGLSSSPDWFAEGGPSWRLGSSVSTAGDVNADGKSDVVIGAPGYSALTPQGVNVYGGCFLYLGGWPGGPLGLPGLTPYATTRLSSTQLGASFGLSVSLAGDVNGDGYGDVIVGAPDFDAFGANNRGSAGVYLGGPSGLDATPHWEEYGINANARFGLVVACAGDVDGDGLADVAASAPEYTSGATSKGYVVIAHGSSSIMTIRWYVEGNQAFGRFGSSIATAGDVDGDGFSDLLVGAYGVTVTLASQGQVQLFRGAADRPSDSTVWQVSSGQYLPYWGWVVDAAGDVNGDGYDDLLISAPGYDTNGADDGRVSLYLGSAGGPIYPPISVAVGSGGGFGTSAACAGDVNGDGYDDVIIGAPDYNGVGRVSVWFGNASGVIFDSPDWVVDGTGGGSRFGASVASAGDFNGDGYGDVIVGAPNATVLYAGEGLANVYYGSETGLLSSVAWWMRGNQVGAACGSSVSCAGDINRDGYSDIAIGMPSWDRVVNQFVTFADVGRVFTVHGGATPPQSNTVYGILQGGDLDHNFGNIVDGAGDVDGDGFSDLLVGHIGAGASNSGAVHVYRGTATGIATSPHWSFSGGQNFSGFAQGASSAGDVNRDGFSDIIVGANFYDSASRNDNGYAWIFAGPLTGGSATTPIWTKAGASSYDNFGQSVGGVGDLNGDGFPDVGVGSTGYTGTQSSEGRAEIFFGNHGGSGSGLPDAATRHVRQREFDTQSPVAMYGRTNERPAFELLMSSRSAAGRTPVRVQWQSAQTGQSLSAATIGSSSWFDSAPAGAGSVQTLLSESLAAERNSSTHWRLRLASSSPYFPRSPWFSLARNGVEEADLRGGVEVSPPTDTDSPRLGHVIAVRAMPNPFNPRTAIHFETVSTELVRVAIYDARGRALRVLVEERLDAGRHEFIWDGLDAAGASVGSGVYYAQVRSSSRKGLTKLTLVR